MTKRRPGISITNTAFWSVVISQDIYGERLGRGLGGAHFKIQ